MHRPVPAPFVRSLRRAGLSALAGLLALALLAGCAGPTVVDNPPAAGHYAVAVRIDPPSVQRGQKATINYAFTDTQTGKQAVNLPLVGNATVHATLVNRDMTWFRTGEAVGPVGGAYPINLQFGDPDSYRLYVEFTTGYTPSERLLYTHTLSFGLNPPSLDQPAALVESASLQNDFYGVAVKLDPGPLKAGQPALFHYLLTANEQPVRDLNAYNGAAGHLFIISADGATFAHLYAREAPGGTNNAESEPTGGGSSGSTSGNPASLGQPGQAAGAPTLAPGAATATPPAGAAPGPSPLGPDLTFAYTFPHPGLYKTWLQYLYHGQVVTADYVVRVNP